MAETDGLPVDGAPLDAAGRRARGSIRPLLLEAARSEFSQRGYAGATTREIARRAGTTESLLFRYFQSKANLFEAAVGESFNSYIEDFVDGWIHREGHSPETPAAEFVRWLYGTLNDNRDLALTILAAHQHEAEVDTDLASVNRLLDRLSDVVTHEAEMRGWRGLDFPIATRAIIGMIAAAALLKDWFYKDLREVTDDEIADTLVSLIVKGFAGQRADDLRAEVVDDPATSKAVVRAPSSHAALGAANEWITGNRDRIRVTDLGWRELEHERIELRIYYERRDADPASPVGSARTLG